MKEGNIRDYADIAQLICLSNLENLNALFISEGKEQSERLRKLNDIAIAQMKLLIAHQSVKTIEHKDRGWRILSKIIKTAPGRVRKKVKERRNVKSI